METLNLNFNRIITKNLNDFNFDNIDEFNVNFLVDEVYKNKLIKEFKLIKVNEEKYVYVNGSKVIICHIFVDLINLRNLIKNKIVKGSIVVVDSLPVEHIRSILIMLQQFRTNTEVFYNIVNDIELILDSIYNVQFLVGLPSNLATPDYITNHALKLKHDNLTFEIYNGTEELNSAKLYAIANVSKGSHTPGKFLAIRFNNGVKKVGIAGKGIIFDTGGINLKSSSAIYDMFCDMAGAATAIEILSYCVKTNMEIDLMITVPLCENSIGGNSYKPGDVINSHKGLKIEVLNTDAEGRIVLADAVSYLNKAGYKHIISIATLTGLSASAFGPILIPFICNNLSKANLLRKVSNESVDKIIELPLSEEFDQLIDSKRIKGAVSNLGNKKFGGIYHGANFIKRFTDVETDFIHLDIAGTAYEDFFNSQSGSTGFGIDLLIRYLKEL